MKEPAREPVQALIGSRIFVLRGQRVMLDSGLAELYGVQTKVLVQALKRKLERFPVDFMFQLEKQDLAALRSQFVTSSSTHGGRRTAPYAFTEQGVAMLSLAPRFKGTEDAQKRVLGRNPVLQHQKLAQLRFLLVRPEGDVLDSVEIR